MHTIITEHKNKSISLAEIYGDDSKNIKLQTNRYIKLSEKFTKHFLTKPEYYFSTPGRTEISGNHTDHNLGKVIAASINLDSIAAVAKSKNSIVVYSDAYDKPFLVSLNDLNIVADEAGTTNSLIRGIAYRIKQLGYNIGGFNAWISSDVLQGSGLSSSASIEVLIGTIFNHLYNEGNISAEEIAKIGQYAENVYFKKPCGLMDQMACAIGGIIAIDFENPENPITTKLNFDFDKQNYLIALVHTGGSHISLTDDYSAVPEEMKQVAEKFGKKVCREISFLDFVNNLGEIRKGLSDRAILRAFHFFKENYRVDKQIQSLNNNNFKLFLDLVNESGNSSYKYLQNIFSPKDVNYQPVALALAFTEEYLKNIGEGACRVHGGGFEGTIQAMIPAKYITDFSEFINNICSDFKVYNINIRQFGTTRVLID